MNNSNDTKLILMEGHIGIEKAKNLLTSLGVYFEKNNRTAFLDGSIIHIESHYGAYWKDFIRGREFSEIIMEENAFKTLDNEDKILLLSSFRKNTSLPERSFLIRQLKNTVTNSRINKELISLVGDDLDSETASWVKGFNFPICDYRPGMAQYFLNADDPTKEEFEAAKFAIGGQYRS